MERAYSIKAASDDDFKRHEPRIQALLNTLRHEAGEKAKAELLATQRQVGETESQSVHEFSLINYAELIPAKRAFDEATSAANANTYFGYLDAFSFCERAKQSLQQARTQFFARGRSEIEQKIASIDGQIAAINNGEITDKWIGLLYVGLVCSVIVGFVQCGRSTGFEEFISAFIGSSLLFAVLSAIVTFIGCQIQKSNALAALTSEKARLEVSYSKLRA